MKSRPSGRRGRRCAVRLRRAASAAARDPPDDDAVDRAPDAAEGLEVPGVLQLGQVQQDGRLEYVYEDASDLVAKIPIVAAFIYNLKYRGDKQIAIDRRWTWAPTSRT